MEIKVPDIGDFADVPVIDVLVKQGDTVEVDTPLITLETEKATMDVPSTAAGRIVALKVAKGAKVSKGDTIATVEAAAGAGKAEAAAAAASSAEAPGESAAPPAAETQKPAPQPAAPQDADLSPAAQAERKAPKSAPSDTSRRESAGEESASAPPGKSVPSQPPSSEAEAAPRAVAYAGPSVRKLARELGVDLSRVHGSGIKGRITHDDVKAFVKKVLSAGGPAPGAPVAALPRIPAVDFAQFGPVEIQPLGRIQRISGARLHASWVNLPHVTQFDRADITEMEDARGKLKAKAGQQGIKLTPLAFVIRACVKAIREFPQFNVSLDAGGGNLVHKKYLHIGFAADTPNGLVVPVIRDADRKDIYELARDLGELSARAREGKLSAAQMQGGCFTVSSLGSIGGTAFTPIINAPEVAILGVSRAEHQPIYQDGAFVPRLMLPLSLSYDHRVIDGALAVRFTTFLAQQLTDVRGLLEAIP